LDRAFDELRVECRRFPASYVGGGVDQRLDEERVERLPARVEVGVVTREKQPVVLGHFLPEGDRGGEAAIEREHRARADALEADRLSRTGEMDATVFARRALDRADLHILAIGAARAKGQRDMHRLLARFRRRRRPRLFYGGTIVAGVRIIAGGDGD